VEKYLKRGIVLKGLDEWEKSEEKLLRKDFIRGGKEGRGKEKVRGWGGHGKMDGGVLGRREYVSYAQ